jgi:hypothetical protein
MGFSRWAYCFSRSSVDGCLQAQGSARYESRSRGRENSQSARGHDSRHSNWSSCGLYTFALWRIFRSSSWICGWDIRFPGTTLEPTLRPEESRATTYIALVTDDEYGTPSAQEFRIVVGTAARRAIQLPALGSFSTVMRDHR